MSSLCGGTTSGRNKVYKCKAHTPQKNPAEKQEHKEARLIVSIELSFTRQSVGISGAQIIYRANDQYYANESYAEF